MIDCRNFTSRLHYAIQKLKSSVFIFCEFDLKKKKKKLVFASDLINYRACSTVVDYSKNLLYILKPPKPGAGLTTHNFTFTFEILKICTKSGKVRKILNFLMNDMNLIQNPDLINFHSSVFVVNHKIGGLMAVNYGKRLAGFCQIEKIKENFDLMNLKIEEYKKLFFAFVGEESSIAVLNKEGNVMLLPSESRFSGDGFIRIVIKDLTYKLKFPSD